MPIAGNSVRIGGMASNLTRKGVRFRRFQGVTALPEVVMRNLAALFVLIVILGQSAPSFARDVSVGKHAAEEVENVCNKVGGKFSKDATGHYCGTDCHGGPGTDCVVGCKTGQPCFAQVIGSRRPTNLVNALQAPPGSPR